MHATPGRRPRARTTDGIRHKGGQHVPVPVVQSVTSTCVATRRAAGAHRCSSWSTQPVAAALPLTASRGAHHPAACQAEVYHRPHVPQPPPSAPMHLSLTSLTARGGVGFSAGTRGVETVPWTSTRQATWTSHHPLAVAGALWSLPAAVSPLIGRAPRSARRHPCPPRCAVPPFSPRAIPSLVVWTLTRSGSTGAVQSFLPRGRDLALEVKRASTPPAGHVLGASAVAGTSQHLGPSGALILPGLTRPQSSRR